ncbi:hypothetical protein G3I60_04995 [Streptomyces sp. SID13666]|uniref:hypothetical protein n=1 Tax=Streptomyces sp. SID13666 TaxID=2706054 RepID=UPI0013C1F405|nr:hypothetical protein [Streptomyces sp. SID13666]NEA53526.1 hypothetical protein [Streptomyces sp. SID13666]
MSTTYDPKPGTDYPIAISDIARAAARILGGEWSAESGCWGVTGLLAAPNGVAFTIGVDHEGDLFLRTDHTDTRDYFLDSYGVSDLDGLNSVAREVAGAAAQAIATPIRRPL